MSFQVTGYLPADDARRFTDYAARFGLDKSALASLLVQRELILDRLPALGRFRHHVPTADCIKITAHRVDASTKAAFEAAAARHGLKPGVAASILFLAENKEHWLEKSLRNS